MGLNSTGAIVLTGMLNHDTKMHFFSGKYCVGGMEAGDCHGGYICWGDMGVPDPDDSYLPLGGLCPYGYYCPSGNTVTTSYLQ